jgi:hypothetical protein
MRAFNQTFEMFSFIFAEKFGRENMRLVYNRFLRIKEMRNIRYNFLFVFGLLLTFGLTTATTFAQNGGRPKNTGTLTVKTSPVAYPVKVNNQLLGMSGVITPAEFYLPPGTHQLVVEGPNGKNFSKANRNQKRR